MNPPLYVHVFKDQKGKKRIAWSDQQVTKYYTPYIMKSAADKLEKALEHYERRDNIVNGFESVKEIHDHTAEQALKEYRGEK